MNTTSPRVNLAYFLITIILVLAAEVSPAAVPSLTPAQLAAMTPLDPASVPAHGNFLYLIGPYPGHPYPPLPCIPPDVQDLSLPVYSLGAGLYLIDDAEVDWEALLQHRQVTVPPLNTHRQFGTDGGALDGPDPLGLGSYPEGSLWLRMLGLTNFETCVSAQLEVHGPDPTKPLISFLHPHSQLHRCA